MKLHVFLVIFGVLAFLRPGFSAEDDTTEDTRILEGDDVESTLEVLVTPTSRKNLLRFETAKFKKSKEKVPLGQIQITDSDENTDLVVNKKSSAVAALEGGNAVTDLIEGTPMQPSSPLAETTAQKTDTYLTPTAGADAPSTRRRKTNRLNQKPSVVSTEKLVAKDTTGDSSVKGTEEASLSKSTAVADAKANNSEAGNVTLELKEEENKTQINRPKTKPASSAAEKESTKAPDVEETTPAEPLTGPMPSKETSGPVAAQSTPVTPVPSSSPTSPSEETTVEAVKTKEPKTTPRATTPPAEKIEDNSKNIDKSGEEEEIPKNTPKIHPKPASQDNSPEKIDEDDEPPPNREVSKDSDAGNASDRDKDKDDNTPFKVSSPDDDDTGNTRFFIFLVIAVGVVLLIYMAYINRAKVMAIVVEGWSSRGGSSRGRGSSSSRNGYQYQPLATRPAASSDSARRPLTGDEGDDEDDTRIIMSAPLGSGSGGSSGRRSPAANQESVIVVDKQTIQAVKNYVY